MEKPSKGRQKREKAPAAHDRGTEGEHHFIKDDTSCVKVDEMEQI